MLFRSGLAEKLGLKELQDAGSVKYASPEDGLQKEVEASGQLLDKVTVELHEKKLVPNEELRKDLELLEKVVAASGPKKPCRLTIL